MSKVTILDVGVTRVEDLADGGVVWHEGALYLTEHGACG
jgi:hypothetical protein